jgi:antitoxin Phd
MGLPRRWTSGRGVIYDYCSHIPRGLMREIQLKDAKARLSAVVDDALRGEEFVITRHGHKAAVVVSWERWRRVSDVPSLGRLLAATPLEAADLAERDDTPLRDADL